jgi:hypothetical protein
MAAMRDELAEGVDRTALDSLAGNFTTRGESA